MHQQPIDTRTRTNTMLQAPSVTGSAEGRRWHRAILNAARERLVEFIEILQQLPRRDGTHTLSMNLFAAYERWCRFELPQGYQLEFGRQIAKACRDGRLPFEKTTIGRASLSAYEGLDPELLDALLLASR